MLYFTFTYLEVMKILLVDDNQSITTMMSKYLTIKGHDCTVANDGRNGLTLIEKEKFDVVLLDIAMPDFTGFDVIDSLAAKGKLKDQKIIFFTATSVKGEQIDEYLKKGVHSVLRKPIQLETLLKVING